MLSRRVILVAMLCVLPVALGASGEGGKWGCEEVEVRKPRVALLIPPDGVRDPEVIPDQYIFGLVEEATEATLRDVEQQIVDGGGRVHHVYWPEIRGIAAYLPPDKLEVLLQNPNVKYIERDRIVRATGMAEGVQACAPWGLDRIDQVEGELNQIYTYKNSGDSVHVYVLDSGIDPDHEEFQKDGQSRVGDGMCVVKGECDLNGIDPSKAEWWNDRCAQPDKKSSGHGTHLAGIVGGKKFGVAKGVQLHAVRVLGCSDANAAKPCEVRSLNGDGSDLIKGIQWAVNHHAGFAEAPGIILIGSTIEKGAFPQPPALPTLNSAMNMAFGAGMLVVASAGNNGKPADGYGPGGDLFSITLPNNDVVFVPNKAITVGALARNGRRLDESNYGAFVDVFAPGNVIPAPVSQSACYEESPGVYTKYQPMSGTSQAASHVAGVAALLWDRMGSSASADTVAMELIGSGKPLSADNLGEGSPPLGLYIDGGLVGSPNKSAATDWDGCMDRAALTNFVMDLQCDGDPHTADCPQGATRGIRCDNGNCSLCGAKGEACCSGKLSSGQTCEASLICDSFSGTCSCGRYGQPCCDSIGNASYCDEPWACKVSGATAFCEQCGGKEQVCCNGACNAGDLACVDGKCAQCGNDTQSCCPGNACNASDLTCKDNKCEQCGTVDKPCCEGTCLADGLMCVDGKCTQCGNDTQSCCSGNACNASDLTCNGHKCEQCGTAGKSCCEGKCLADALMCDAGKCVECGNDTQSCCPGNACNASNLTCKGHKCEQCGTVDKSCCEGVCLAEGLLCNATSQCAPCGGPDEPCCPGNMCNSDGLHCSASGVCEKLPCQVRCRDDHVVTIFDVVDLDVCINESYSACSSHDGRFRVRYGKRWVYCHNNLEGCYTRCAGEIWTHRGQAEWGNCLATAHEFCEPDAAYATWCYVDM